MTKIILKWDGSDPSPGCDRACGFCCQHIFIVDKAEWELLKKFYLDPALDIYPEIHCARFDVTDYFNNSEIIELDPINQVLTFAEKIAGQGWIDCFIRFKNEYYRKKIVDKLISEFEKIEPFEMEHKKKLANHKKMIDRAQIADENKIGVQTGKFVI